MPWSQRRRFNYKTKYSETHTHNMFLHSMLNSWKFRKFKMRYKSIKTKVKNKWMNEWLYSKLAREIQAKNLNRWARETKNMKIIWFSGTNGLISFKNYRSAPAHTFTQFAIFKHLFFNIRIEVMRRAVLSDSSIQKKCIRFAGHRACTHTPTHIQINYNKYDFHISSKLGPTGPIFCMHWRLPICSSLKINNSYRSLSMSFAFIRLVI